MSTPKDFSAPSMPAQARFGWLLCILLLALALRMIRLGYADYWHDEVHNFVKVEFIWAVITKGEFVSNHPPMFTTLLWIWSHLGLTGTEYTARMLTVILGVAGVAATYFTGRRLLDDRSALAGAFLMAISPFAIHHAQDLKDYILLPIFCTVTAWFIWKANESNRKSDWAVYGLFACLCCYADIFAAPFLVGINLWFLIQLPGRVNRFPGWFVSNLLGAIGFLPYFFILWRRFDLMILQGPAVWIPRPGLIEVIIFAKTIAFGYSAMDPAWKIGLVVYGAATGIGLFLVFRRNVRLGLLILSWMVLSVAVTYGASQVRQSIFLYRGLIWVAVPAYLMIAYAITRPKSIPVRSGAIVVLCIITAFSLWQKYTFQFAPDEFPHRPAIHPPKRFAEATNIILENWQDGDGVVQGSSSAWYPFFYYGLRGKPHTSAGPSREAIEISEQSYPRTTRNPEWAGYFDHLPPDTVGDHQRIWFVFEDWERVYYEANVMPTWRWLNSRFTEIGHWNLGEFELFLYDADPAARPVAQTYDNGVERHIHLPGQPSPYVQTLPDTGVVPRPAEERRGPLTLEIVDEADSGAQAIALATGETPRHVAFRVTNESSTTIHGRLMVVASTMLVDAAGFIPVDRAHNDWAVNDAYNPAPPPANHRLPVAVAHLRHGEADSLEGEATGLGDGTYATSVFYMGEPNQPAYSNAPVTLRVGNTDLLGARSLPPNDAPSWRWLTTLPVTVTGAPPVPIDVTAAPLADRDASYANIGYIALYRSTGNLPVPIYDEGVEFAPGAHTWQVTLDHDVTRFDVFVLEHTEAGYAYRVFQGALEQP